MHKAICWELTTSDPGVTGFRILVAGSHVAMQTLVSGNEKPRWSVSTFATAQEATQQAVDMTQGIERHYSARLSVEPGEIIIHDSELSGMSPTRPIPPSLRARVYTSLHRRRAVSVEAS
jgi:hypothetical protein